MPEPDFAAIAERFFGDYVGYVHDPDATIAAMVEQLRQIWNTRGAADCAMIDAQLSSQMGATAAGPYVKNLERAIGSLDR